TVAVTLTSSVALGLIGWWPDWFFQPNQTWLIWLVTGGVGLFAFSGSVGWLSGRWKLLPVCVGSAVAAWLFVNISGDEFGGSLTLQNRVMYLVPGLMLLGFQAWSGLVAKDNGFAPRLV